MWTLRAVPVGSPWIVFASVGTHHVDCPAWQGKLTGPPEVFYHHSFTARQPGNTKTCSTRVALDVACPPNACHSSSPAHAAQALLYDRKDA